jgi:hypothetical protein
MDMRLGGPQSQSGRCGEEKNLDLAGIRTPGVARHYTSTIMEIHFIFAIYPEV